MTKTIWKFPLQTTDIQILEMPEDAEILDIQNQNGQACMWVLCHPDAPKVKRGFEIFGTGHPVPEAKRKYIGTYQVGGDLVFHCFELLSLK